MEELSLNLWDLLFLPVSLPLRSAMLTLSYLKREVDESASQHGVWEELLEIEVLREIGQITDQEYTERRSGLEAQLLISDVSLAEDEVNVNE